MIDSGILIVDDDEQYLNLLRRLLQVSGVTARFATSGAQALEMLRHERVAVLVTDYRMPGLNGLELAWRARQILPELTVIMNTGDFTPETEEAAARVGIAKVLEKPLSFEYLTGLSAGGRATG